MSTFTEEFKKQTINYLDANTPRIKACLNELNETELWESPGPASNSVGNLVLHLCGNITQYVISCLGNKEDLRERDLEFSVKGGFTPAVLLDKISNTLSMATGIIK